MKKRRPGASLRAWAWACASALIFVAAAPGRAEIFWQGPGDGFADGGNWLGGTAPGVGQTAVFDGATPLAVRLSGASASLAALDFRSPGYSLAVRDGSLTLTGLTAASGGGRIVVGSGGTLVFQGQQVDPGAAFEWWLDSVSAGVPVTLDGGRLVNAASILYPSWPETPGPPTYYAIGYRLELPRLDVGAGGGTIEAAAIGSRTPWMLVNALEGTGRLRIASGEVTVGTTSYAGSLAIDRGARLNIGTVCCAWGPVYNYAGSSFDISRITRIENEGTLVIRGNFLSTDINADVTGAGSLTLFSNPRDSELRILGTLAQQGGTTFAASPSILYGNTQNASRATPLVTFTIGDGGSRGWVEGDITVGERTRLVFHRGDDVTYAGTITGAGGVTQRGPGRLRLTGQSAVSGLVTVEGGSLLVEGSLSSQAGVEVRSGNLLVTGQLTAPEVRLGAGAVFDLRGSLSTGRVEVGTGARFLANTDASTLRVDVLDGGVVSGSGRLGSLAVSGVLAPGNSIGTLNLAGDLRLGATAVTQIEVQGLTSDRIQVGGSVRLGGTLQVLLLSGGYAINTVYPVIAAEGGVTGSFSRTEVNSTDVEAVAMVGAQSLGVLLRPVLFLPFLDQTATPNARRAASAFDIARRAGGDGSGYAGLLGAPVPAITPLANTMAGEIATALPALGQRFAGGLLSALLAPRPLTQGLTLWTAGLGGGEQLRGTGGTATRDLRAWGFVGGVDHLAPEIWRGGLALAAAGGTASLSGALGRAEAQSLLAGGHGALTQGRTELRVAASLGWMEADTRRTLAGQRTTAQGIGSTLWGARAELRQSVFEAGHWRVAPLLAIQSLGIQGGGFREEQTPGVTVASRARALSRWEAGVAAEGQFAVAGLPVALRGQAGLADYLAQGGSRFASLNGIESAAFLVEGARRSRQAALLSAAAELAPRQGLRLRAALEAELSNSTTALAGQLRLGWAF